MITHILSFVLTFLVAIFLVALVFPELKFCIHWHISARLQLRTKSIPLWTFIFLIFLLNSPAYSIGGLSPGSPFPGDPHNLSISKEDVTIGVDSKYGPQIIANYWIENLTGDAVNTTITIPIYGSHQLASYYSGEDNGYIKLIKISINENSINDIKYALINDSLLHYKFNVIFPGKSKTNLKFIFSILPTSTDYGDSIVIEYGYMSHYDKWDGPVKKSEIKLCTKEAKLVSKFPDGQVTIYNEKGFTKVDLAIVVSPRDFKIDSKSKCLYWQRSNSLIMKAMLYSIRIEKQAANYINVIHEWGNRESPFKSIMNKWCGIHPKYREKHFADTIDLQNKIFNEKQLTNIIERSYVYGGGAPNIDDDYWGKPMFYSLPDHWATDYQLVLLRYLRNSIHARHGYEFKDKVLAECFKDISRLKTELSEIENSNVNAINNLEKKIKSKNKAAWEHYEDNIVQY